MGKRNTILALLSETQILTEALSLHGPSPLPPMSCIAHQQGKDNCKNINNNLTITFKARMAPSPTDDIQRGFGLTKKRRGRKVAS